MSLGIYYYDPSIEKPDWTLLYQPSVMQSEDDAAGGLAGLFGGPFVNQYGYDADVVSGLYYSALGTILIPIVSLPLAGFNMLLLIGYLLLQPLVFQGEYPDEVTFTSEDYWSDVVERQVAGASGFLLLFVFGWLFYLYPTYMLVTGFTTVSEGNCWPWFDWTIVAWLLGAWAVNLVIFGVSFYFGEGFYGDWETPAELRYL